MGMRLGAVLLALSIGVGACGATPDEQAAPAPVDEPAGVQFATVTERAEPTIDDAGDVALVAHAERAFAFDLFAALDAETDQNIVVGPYSAWLALTMLSRGADGDTLAELDEALHHPLDEDRLLPAVNALDRILTARSDDEAVTFSVANRVWGQAGLAFVPEYLDDMVEHFGAPVVTVDFAGDPEGARAAINDWVADSTADRIDELFPEGSIDPQTVAALVNAMHLDAPWEFGFDPAATTRGTFTTATGAEVAVPLMQYHQFLPNGRVGTNAIVELPYEASGLSMLVIVPDEVGGLDELDEATYRELVESIDPERGIHLALPSFRFDFSTSLVPALRSLGIGHAFDDADFSRMVAAGGIWVDAVEHQAFVEVDEEGTEAAAATGVAMAGSHGPTVVADRPFVFVIRDRATDTILFLGRVEVPTN